MTQLNSRLEKLFGKGTFLRNGKVFSKDSKEIDISEMIEHTNNNLATLSVNVTGARPGEIISGFRSGAKSAKMRIDSGIVPASFEDLTGLMLSDVNWDMFLQKLGTLSFFESLTPKERESWLLDHEKFGEFDMAEVPITVTVLDVGTSAFSEKLDEEVIQSLLGVEMTCSNLRKKFPGKPGVVSKRNVLTFFPRYWKIESLPTTRKWKGLVTDLLDIWNLGAPKNAYVIETSEFSIGILPSSEKPVQPEKIIRSRIGDQYDIFLEGCVNFTPAVYKSLLQKLIRYSPLTLDLENGRKLPGKIAIQACFTALFLHPGSFVPDIQRFVSGRESAVKRLMISLIEDSWAPGSTLQELALLSMNFQRFDRPISSETFSRLLDYAEEGWATRNVFVHSRAKESGGFKLSEPRDDLTKFQNASVILDDVRSFQMDLIMTRALAREPNYETSKLPRPLRMFISRSLDQHSFPEIAYLFSSETLKKYYDGDSTHPYRNFFHELFLQVSGKNSRRKTTGISGHIPKKDDILSREARSAQKLLLEIRRGTRSEKRVEKQTGPKPEPRETRTEKQTQPRSETRISGFGSRSPTTLEGKLGIEWISGMVGVIPVSLSAIASLRPEDPYQIVALPKPSRGKKESFLPDEVSEKAISSAKKSLAEGVQLLKVPPFLPKPLKKIFLMKVKGEDEPQYLFAESKSEIQKGNYLTWDEFSSYSVDSSLDPEVYPIPEDPKVARRILTYLSSYGSEIEVTRLSKDGGGTELFASLLDAPVTQFFLELSDQHPDVLERMQGYLTRYRIRKAPVLWRLRDILIERLSKNKTPGGWKSISDSSGRKPKSYQIESVEEMLRKPSKGNFLWLSVGLGKTMIVMLYLSELIRLRKLPRYVVYTLPKSAIASVIREIDAFGMPLNVCIPIQAWKKNQFAARSDSQTSLVERRINLIDHDHLRKMETELVEKATDTFLIIDEVHKTFGETKRTSVALEIARLSQNFVALTGTVVVDTNLYQLIWWLEQILPYEVTENNFWSAINGMVSKKTTTGIDVIREEVVAPFTKVESIEYSKRVPGMLGGKNAKPSHQDFQKAFEISYQACTRKMIELALEISKKEPVMLISRNYEHQKELASAFEKSRKSGFPRILCIGPESVTVTDDLVESGKAEHFDIAIVPQSFSTGYTLTYAKTQITGVYPSNQANREQLEGRINRITQKSKVIHYYIVTCGILNHVLEKHASAASLSAVMSSIQKEVEGLE